MEKVFVLQFGLTPTAKLGQKQMPNPFGWAEPRVFLDEQLVDGNELLQEIRARNWREARERVVGQW